MVSSLSPQSAAEVRDLLLNLLRENACTIFERPANQAHHHVRPQEAPTALYWWETWKPTQFLRRIQQLLGDHQGSDTFLHELFLQRLPCNVCMVLASTPEGTTIDQLAEMADKIMKVASPAVSALSKALPTFSPTPVLAEEVRQLHSEVSRQEKLFIRLPRNRSLSQSNRRPSGRSSTPPQTDDSLCWYHSKYGDKVQKCRSPCSWSSNGQAGH